MLFIETWRAIDQEAASLRDDNARSGQDRYDWRPLVVLAIAAMAVTIAYYAAPSARAGGFRELPFHLRQLGWQAVSYIAIPILAILAMPGERLRDYFLSIRGTLTHAKSYAIVFVILLPGLYVLAQLPAVQERFPAYQLAGRSVGQATDLATADFLVWTGITVARVIAVEFFFRGFLLRSLFRSFGSLAIFVMVVPYTMIFLPPQHTVAEALAAIPVGIVLGTLAMRAKSIWGGVLLHAAALVSLDALIVYAS